MKQIYVPAVAGFEARQNSDGCDWCHVVAWRIDPDGGRPCPVTLWGVIDSEEDGWLVRCPDGYVEDLPS